MTTQNDCKSGRIPMEIVSEVTLKPLMTLRPFQALFYNFGVILGSFGAILGPKMTWTSWSWVSKLSSLDLRECILAIFGPPGPLGGVRGGMGGSGGVPGTKNCNFFGSHIWVTNWEILDCMNWKHFIFQVFGQKWPLRRPKMVVFGLKWVNTKVHFSQKHPL